jgi:hypothetical protein
MVGVEIRDDRQLVSMMLTRMFFKDVPRIGGENGF